LVQKVVGTARWALNGVLHFKMFIHHLMLLGINGNLFMTWS